MSSSVLGAFTNSYNFCTNGGTIWRAVLLRTGEGRYVLVKAWLSDEDAIE